jgi:hypothetical protein
VLIATNRKKQLRPSGSTVNTKFIKRARAGRWHSLQGRSVSAGVPECALAMNPARERPNRPRREGKTPGSNNKTLKMFCNRPLQSLHRPCSLHPSWVAHVKVGTKAMGRFDAARCWSSANSRPQGSQPAISQFFPGPILGEQRHSGGANGSPGTLKAEQRNPTTAVARKYWPKIW